MTDSNPGDLEAKETDLNTNGGTVESKEKKVHFAMLGGFLGAGKTTALGKIAAGLIRQGKKVAIVTNDQAFGLVDTASFRNQGLSVGEVAGACFCCKFDDLLKTTESLAKKDMPEIILAEPVGSCTDLQATIILPMKELFGDRFQIGQLVVLMKPEHGKRILLPPEAGKRRGGFSPKAEYIFERQLKEADVIAIHKVDKLSESQQKDLSDAIKQKYPEKKLVLASSKTGQGIEDITDQLLVVSDNQSGSSMEMDYQLYAEGEAELGWLNCQVTATANSNDFDLDHLVTLMVDSIGRKLVESGSEPAHLKILGQSETESSVANMVSSDCAAELSLASEIRTSRADLLVNARIAASPEELEQAVRHCCDAISFANLEVHNVQSFRPSPPKPTHRIS